MNKIKKMIAALAAACMMLATCTTAFAAENASWKNYDYSKYASNWSGGNTSSNSTNGSGWGSGSGWSWGNGWNWGGNNNPGTGGDDVVEDTSLAAPEIGECRYIHQTLNAPDCLVVKTGPM